MEERAAEAPPRGGAVVRASPAPVLLSDVTAAAVPRIPTGIADMDRVLGGGLVPGSVVLVGGEPGIGKSTLLLQISARLSERLGSVLYVSAEESAQQIKMRADRLRASAPGLFLLPETSLETILEAARAGAFGAIVVDSIQTIASAESPAAAGS
ncbi:MAG: ATPase domain-containing protein, partial [Thermoanaerobaculia bacterium]